MTQPFFMRPGPPNFLMSWQNWQLPHSFLLQPLHRLQRTRRRRSTDREETGFRGRGVGGFWEGPARGR